MGNQPNTQKPEPRPERPYQVSLIAGFLSAWVLAVPFYPLWFREVSAPIVLTGVAFNVVNVLYRFLGWRETHSRSEPIVSGLSDGIGLAALLIVIVAFYGHVQISLPF